MVQSTSSGATDACWLWVASVPGSTAAFRRPARPSLDEERDRGRQRGRIRSCACARRRTHRVPRRIKVLLRFRPLCGRSRKGRQCGVAASDPSQPTAWAGEVHLGDGWLCFIGPMGTTSPHAHHAVQVIVASEPFGLHADGGEATSASAAVIPANAVHSLTANGQRGWLLYLQHVRGGRSVHPSSWVADACDVADPQRYQTVAGWATATAISVGSAETEPAGFVVAAMTGARSVLPQPVRLAEIAREVGVAPTTLSRAFTRAVGVPWRRWVLTERLRVAAESLASGANLTVAAHSAGFADSAHLTRTFRRMFGIAPSDLTSVARWHVD